MRRSESRDTLADAVASAGLPVAALIATRAWLIEQLIAQEYAKLGQGGHTHNQVPLRRVFVDLPVTDSLSSIAPHDARLPFLENLLISPPLPLRRACQSVISQSDPPGHSPSLGDLEPAKRSRDLHRLSGFSATLLIGGPGQGKSTLGQLACQLHRASLLKPIAGALTSTQRELVNSFEPRLSGNASPVPLRPPKRPLLPLQVSLPDLASWLAKESTNPDDDSPTLLRFLAQLPSARSNGVTAESLLQLTVQMPSILVLDGFDEVGATKDRERIVAATRDFLSRLAKDGAFAQVLATTRPQGYAGELAEIGLALRERYLAPLVRSEAVLYAEKLVRAKVPGSDLQAKILLRLQEAASEPATERLMTTPLQVTILVALLQQLGRAPRERWNLFSRYFAYTYDREIERESYASRLLAEHRSRIELIHARVALLLQVEAERDGGAARMSRARLGEVIEAVLLEEEVADEDRNDLIRDIAAAAEQRLVFLVEPEPGSFGFEIRSLQEFMAAWALSSGRDAEVEARLLQVARSPMFRNVVLFMASRFFSEGSPLRDVLAGDICANLDEDLTDELSRLARSGSLLALETLEEGAVLSQPKRSRALMERATGLLDLPAGPEHGRLARAVTADTAAALAGALETRLSPKKGRSSYAAWVCLLEATNRGEAWAIEIAEENWRKLSEPSEVVETCVRCGIRLGSWIVSKVEQYAARISPDSFLQGEMDVPVEGGPAAGWVSWLSAVYSDERWVDPLSVRRLRNVSPAAVREPDRDGRVPEAWRPWIAAARFEVNPNAPNLVAAIESIAKQLTKEQWEALEWRSAWPLAACLAGARDANQLRRFGKKISTRALGDEVEWRAAEQSWMEEVDPRSALAHVGDVPWSRAALRQAPPLAIVPVWALTSRRQDAAGTLASIREVNSSLPKARSAAARRLLSDLCLSLIRRLPRNSDTTGLSVETWLRNSEDGVRFLVPRPKVIPPEQWVELFDHVPPRRRGSLSSLLNDPAVLVEAVLESRLHPVVVRLASRSWAMTARSHYRRFAPPKKALLGSLDAMLAGGVGAEAHGPPELLVLRLLVGNMPPEGDDEFFRKIADAAEGDPSLWSLVFSAIGAGSLQPIRASALLARTYRETGPDGPGATEGIQQMRAVLQSRKSGLESQVTWNRLALGLPYPQSPPRPRMAGGIPVQAVTIQSIELRDVRGLNHLKLSVSPPRGDSGQWLVILGPNGVGKTTLLQSLALALRNVNDPAIWPRGAFGESWLRVARDGEAKVGEARISVRLGDGIEHETLLRPGEGVIGTRLPSITQLPEQEGPRLLPLFGYGCRRGSALGGAARQVDLKDDDGPEIATLFDEGAPLIHAETWLLQLEGDASKSTRSKGIFMAVTDALRELLELQAVEVADRRVWIVGKDGVRLPFSALSDGYLTSTGWFLDLVARWLTLAEQCNYSVDGEFLSLMKGLVLVDELDLHLHPRWQVEVIARTRKLLPQMSFVITTHNPLTLVGARPEEIWILQPQDEGSVRADRGVEAPMLLTGSQIYRRYFGIDDIYPDGLGRSLQRYAFLSGYALRSDEEEAELQRLRDELRDAGVEAGWDVVARSSPERPDS
jgi:hypothetical protein